MAQALVTGRTAERLLFALRVKIFAHLQRLGLDYYERELGGPDHDPHDQRRRRAGAALPDRARHGAGRRWRRFVGVGIALLVMNAELALADDGRAAAADRGHARGSGARSAGAYDRARERIAHRQRRPAGEPVRACGSRRRSAGRSRNAGRFAGVEPALPRRPAAAPSGCIALYFPFVEFLVRASPRSIVLGVGAGWSATAR